MAVCFSTCDATSSSAALFNFMISSTSGTRGDEGRRKSENVVMRYRAWNQPVLQRSGCDVRTDLQRAIERTALFLMRHEFECGKHPGIAHSADERMRAERGMQLREQIAAHVRRHTLPNQTDEAGLAAMAAAQG